MSSWQDADARLNKQSMQMAHSNVTIIPVLVDSLYDHVRIIAPAPQQGAHSHTSQYTDRLAKVEHGTSLSSSYMNRQIYLNANTRATHSNPSYSSTTFKAATVQAQAMQACHATECWMDN